MKVNFKNHLKSLKAIALAGSFIILNQWGGVKAQSNLGSLRMDARNGQGFIVMNQPINPYTCWRFVFSERTGFSSPRNPNGIVPLNNLTVCGKDYIKVPDSYRYDKNRDIIVSVYGLTKTTETLVLNNISIGNYQGPSKIANGPIYAATCGTYCDGNNFQQQSYALQFRIYQDITNSGSKQLIMESPIREVINGNVNLPYYGCYTPAQADSWLAARGHYEGIAMYLQGQNQYNSVGGISPLLNTSALATGVYAHDPAGNAISGNYYMIPKDFGPWEPARGFATIENYLGSCNANGINLYMSQMNSKLDQLAASSSSLAFLGNLPNLTCVGDGASFQSGGGYSEVNCNLVTESFDSTSNYWQYLQSTVGCYDINSNNPNWNWYDNIAFANIVSATGSGSTKPTWTFHGVPSIGERVVIPAGLYVYNIVTKSGEYKRMIVEAKQNFVYSTKISDVVNELIFPVPIINNDYSINIETPIDVTIQYELWDGKGNKIYDDKMLVSKTNITPTTIKVNPNFEIPAGNLIHKFIFSDGSSEIINTIK